MRDQFTQGLEKRFDYLEKDNAEARERLKAFRLEIDKANNDLEAIRQAWDEEMGYIQQSYIASGRRFLLNWLAGRIKDEDWLSEHLCILRSNPKTPKATLSIDKDRVIHYQMNRNNQYAFGTDMNSAVTMTKQDALTVCTLIRNLCGGTSKDLPYIKTAFGANETTGWLSKEDAFYLGHLLGFDDIEMQEFLMRYFQTSDRTENDAAINYKSSNELIHLFTLKYPQFDFSDIQDAYQRKSVEIPKADPEDETGRGITEAIAGYVQDEEPDWMSPDLSDDDRKNSFLNWLVENAAYLDIPSNSGTELVRLLARKILAALNAHSLLGVADHPPITCPIPNEPVPELGTPLVKAIQKDRRCNILRKEQWTNDNWKSASDLLLYYLNVMVNHDLSDIECGEPKVFQEIDPDDDAETIKEKKISNKMPLQESNPDAEYMRLLFSYIVPATSNKTVRIGERKVEDWATFHKAANNHLLAILTGAVPAQKGDVLLLLLMLSCIKWKTNTERQKTLAEELTTKLREFQVPAAELLDGKKYPSLGRWYLPHYLEYTIMKSVVYAEVDEQYSAFGWYCKLITRQYEGTQENV